MLKKRELIIELHYRVDDSSYSLGYVDVTIKNEHGDIIKTFGGESVCGRSHAAEWVDGYSRGIHLVEGTKVESLGPDDGFSRTTFPLV